MQKLIGLKIDEKLKTKLEKLAEDEERSLSGFIRNAIYSYVKERYNIDLKKGK